MRGAPPYPAPRAKASLRGLSTLPHARAVSYRSLPLEVRLQDLLRRMTAAEKGSNLHDGVPRLGVPVFSASEDTHGIGCGCAPPITNSTEADGIGAGLGSGSGCPTTFPNGPSLGASFDRKLWTSIGRTIGLEARGLTNQGHCTLYFLDPNINLLRDPRWGRAQEIPGICTCHSYTCTGHSSAESAL